MKFIKDICRGMLIGVANIIPGVSGGTMAVSMGIYDKIIYSITHLRKDFKKSVQTLLPIGIGAVLGLIGLSFVIEWLFEQYPVQTNLLFIGLILGGLPMIFNRIDRGKIGIKGGIAFFVLFALVVILPFLGSGEAVQLSVSPKMMLSMLFVGIIAAATMVVPGVSGSMVLLVLGFYEPVLSTITGFTVSLTQMDMQGLLDGCLLLGPMAIGIVVGIVVIAKIIEYLFANHATMTFCGILGLVIGSPIAILHEANMTQLDSMVIITAAIAFVVGFVIAMLLGGEEEPAVEEEIEERKGSL